MKPSGCSGVVQLALFVERTQMTGTNPYLPASTIRINNCYLLNVWFPGSTGAPLRMAHIISKRRFLSRYLTSRHFVLPPSFGMEEINRKFVVDYTMIGMLWQACRFGHGSRTNTLVDQGDGNVALPTIESGFSACADVALLLRCEILRGCAPHPPQACSLT
jgi:hypothetical protein